MTDTLSYFKETYEESKKSFIDLSQSFLGGELRSHKISGTDLDLSFETFHIPPVSGNKERLLILTSGIHGIEGFTGSALQRFFLQENFWNLKDENMGVLIIHGINPYGFKNKRRVTENNVDLNRNFDISKNLFKNENSGYAQVYDLLNCKKKSGKFSFYLSALKSIKKYGKESLRRAIVKGQYQFPEGIFFGGKDFEPQVQLVQIEVKRLGEGYHQVLMIDLHTGYGKRSKLHLFGDRSTYIDQKYMDEIFKGLDVDYGQEKDFYEVTGGFTLFMAKIFHCKAKFAGICFEFGTIDSHKTLGSLDSLYRMVNEIERRDLFVEMFYPSSLEWRKAVAEQFKQAIIVSMQNFQNSKTNTLPVIDVSSFISRKNNPEVIKQLSDACRKHGFFYIGHHGIDPFLESKLEKLSEEFFALSMDEKMKISMKHGGKAWRGFFPVGDELTSGKPDLKEGLYFGAELDESHPDVKASLPLHGKNLFPERPSELGATVLEYIEKMEELGQAVMRGIALSLELEEDFFIKTCTANPLVLFRIFHYPKAVSSEEKGLWGVGEHTDYGLLTILKQDNQGGLEIRTKEGWIAAPPIQNTFVCNIGDMLDRMTGGVYRSTPHRVKNTSGNNRLSYPFFFDPGFHTEVSPLPLTDEQKAVSVGRWDGADLRKVEGTYGSYLLKKVEKVFPNLSKEIK